MRERLDDFVVRVLNTVLRVIAVAAELPPLSTYVKYQACRMSSRRISAWKRLNAERLTPTPTRTID
jgi:hypothetical protein